METEQRIKNAIGPWRRLKVWTVLVGFAALISLNVATLLNDEIHSLGFRALQSVLGIAVSDAVLARVTAHSTTAKRRADVAIATATLSQEQLRLNKENADLKAKNVKHGQVVKTVSQRIEQRSLSAAKRNVASLAGEAIPILGTTLVVGVTAWDIYDLCESLKDMNVINAEIGNTPIDQQAVCGMTIPKTDQVVTTMTGNWRHAYSTASSYIYRATQETTPPAISWKQAKSSICPVISLPSPFCP